VERAIQVVREALRLFGPPVYVRKQIVHNAHVVQGLAKEGAVFVESEEEVPEGSVLVFSAHGVSPEVHARARARHLRVLDATCPLVMKVHAEARRFASRGYTIFLIGHAGHEEVEGTMGEAPERIRLVQTPEEALSVAAEDPGKVAYLTQTTLSQDEAAEVLAALRGRFPRLVGPPSEDICYATQNRQDAVRALAARSQLVLVVGSKNSSNSNRLVEVARKAGTRAELVEDADAVDPGWLAGVEVVGLTSGASAPEYLVQGVLDLLAREGFTQVEEVKVAEEALFFELPGGLRAASHEGEAEQRAGPEESGRPGLLGVPG
jgi:4-hydroxy-3-methylbut-2-enyl diphosphate reductase